MVLGSHNSWSFLNGKKWWMNLFHFVAQCQEHDIKTQYEEYGVRCFDLRVKYDKDGNTIFAHGKYVYDYTIEDVRFKAFCNALEETLPNIKFWNGNNLYNGKNDYAFKNRPSCLELYSSVRSPKLIDDWIPRLYAFLHNKKNIRNGTNRDIMLVDFVNYR